MRTQRTERDTRRKDGPQDSAPVRGRQRGDNSPSKERTEPEIPQSEQADSEVDDQSEQRKLSKSERRRMRKAKRRNRAAA